MEHIDSAKLYADGGYRFEYVAKFMDFGEADINAIKSVAEKVRPLIPVVVDAVYNKLFQYDVTKKHFLPKNEGFEGEVATSLEDLTLEHPQIKFRKDFLSKYLNKLLDGPYDDRFLRYLDWVAKIHTDTPTKKSKINVDYIHINALMGFVETTLVGGLLSLNLDRETEGAALGAFNKLLWIQNDYFAKYYCNPVLAAPTAEAKKCCAKLCDNPIIPVIVGALAGGLGVWFSMQRK
ncbi:Protoglobin-domain-containing protein [Radiomyces spectabilis]|uniref:Protoglobin-domain-containing protein n=1 Tax=Radiomyces spectabilis TaxID=64574 RepID=UPI00222115CE|nr:Protoglobin-domain-containing protein [Radiomyces spectabilis]KAI8391222.1 Protoglobin-domain-containing protein [Radiomyces spectabilis]